MISAARVSVVIVNWNNFADTSECLDSLRRASYPNFEVVLVDNASTGDDARLIREGYGDFVRLIENSSNEGFAEGCNIGMKDALGRGADYIVLLNNDTVAAPDFLDRIIPVMEADRRIGIAGGMVYSYEAPELIWFGGGRINYRTGNTPIRGSAERDVGQYSGIADVDWICGCYMVLSRETLDKAGLLDRRFFFGWEDADISVRAARAGFRVVFVPDSRIWHKTFSEVKQDRLMGMPVYYATRGHFIFMEKHFTRFQLCTAGLYFIVSFPRFLRDYTRILGRRKVPLYIFMDIYGYLTRRWRQWSRVPQER
ncbi:MAG: glycosyltransferase family 2 protein [Dehalococcoidia bacterium]|nr:glycosyltransferase family 2 protein [Dehalococcoidia bacterium]